MHNPVINVVKMAIAFFSARKKILAHSKTGYQKTQEFRFNAYSEAVMGVFLQRFLYIQSNRCVFESACRESEC